MSEGPAPEQIAKARQLILAELARRRMIPTIEAGTFGEEIRLSNGVSFTVESFADRIRHAGPEEWEAMARHLIDTQLRLAQRPDFSHRPPEEILSRIRTRLIPKETPDEELFSYGREFAGDLIQILCEDTPEAAVLLTTHQITQIPVPLDELFRVGQQNTDAEPLDRLEEFEKDIYAIEGTSMYTAAKAANMGELIKRTIGAAPAGVVFIVPNRSTLVFTAADPADPIDALVNITKVMENIWQNPNFFHPGGFISPTIFYWSPENTIDPVGWPMEKDGKTTLGIVPSDTYLKYCPLG